MTVELKRRRRWPWVVGGVVATLAIASAIAIHVLDSFLLKKVQEEVAGYSQRLERPIRIGGLSTTFLSGLGVRVTGVELGPGPGEDVPVVSLPRVEVRADLVRAFRSKGKEILVDSIEIERPVVNLLRLPDGMTNLSRLQERFEATAPPEPPPSAQEEPPPDLSNIRVGRVALVDGVVRLVDRTDKTAHELAISDLDITVQDIRAGAPLEVLIQAAVLAEKQNFELKLRSAPLPASLQPVPEQVTLKVEPIDLAPLVPFLPRGVGLKAGRFDANWTVHLGGAVPGGTGPTRLTGGLHAGGLRFAEAAGGKPLDVALETEVTADLGQGDLTIDKLRVELGPAAIRGKGQVKGLLSGKPEVRGLEVAAHGLDPAVLASYYPPLRAKLQGMIAGPIGLSLRGSGTEDSQSITLDLDLTPVRLTVPEELTKEAGTPLKLTARVSGDAAGGGTLRFNTKADLSGVDLRPGELVNKGPGERLEIEAQGRYHPAAGAKAATRVDLSTLKVALLDATMTGKGSVALAGKGKAQTTSVELALASPRLDLDKLMVSSDDEEEPAPGTPPKPPPPPKDPHRFDGIRAKVSARIDSFTMKGSTLSNVAVGATMVDDVFTVERLVANAFGGTLDGGGTRMKLGPAQRPFDVRLKVRNLGLGEAIKRGGKPVVNGNFNGDIDLSGAGTQIDNLAQTLAGLLQGRLTQASFLGKDILGAVTTPLAKALPYATTLPLKAEGSTFLGRELPFGLTIEKGLARLKAPLHLERSGAGLTLTGGVRLDGTLDMGGTVELSPAFISTLTRGRATLKEPIPLAFKLTGSAWNPEVSGLDVKPAVETILKQAAHGAATRLLGEKGGKVVQEVLDGKAEQRLAEERAKAEQRMAEERAKAEAAAKQRVAEERAKLEAETKERLERARKQAEEKAKQGLRGLFGR